VSRGQRGGSPTAVNLSFLHRSRYFFFQVAPHLLPQGLSGPRSRPTATQKIWQRRESNPGPLCVQPGSVTTRPQRRSYDSDTGAVSALTETGSRCDRTYGKLPHRGSVLSVAWVVQAGLVRTFKYLIDPGRVRFITRSNLWDLQIARHNEKHYEMNL
jgi:hypothetical protein